MLTTVKTANPSIHMRLRAEHPRERLRTNSLGKRAIHDFRCWSEKKVGFNCLYPHAIALRQRRYEPEPAHIVRSEWTSAGASPNAPTTSPRTGPS